jgi:hypothetical protein
MAAKVSEVEGTVDDATTAIELIQTLDVCVASVTGDAAYDSIAFYDTACARGAPNRSVTPSPSRERKRSGRPTAARASTTR